MDADGRHVAWRRPEDQSGSFRFQQKPAAQRVQTLCVPQVAPSVVKTIGGKKFGPGVRFCERATHVSTCMTTTLALAGVSPIARSSGSSSRWWLVVVIPLAPSGSLRRSEERRVGLECVL